MSKRKKKVNSLFRKPILLIASLIIVVVAGYVLFTSLAKPSQINLISDTTTSRYAGANGCYYKEVQCFQAPCEPILVCPPSSTPSSSPTPTPTVSATWIPTPTPTHTPTPTPFSPSPKPSYTAYPSQTPLTSAGLATFKAANPCGTSSYTSITFSCFPGKSPRVITAGVCTDMMSSMKKALLDCTYAQGDF